MDLSAVSPPHSSSWSASLRAWLPCVLSPLVATALFWSVFGACVADVPDEPPEPAARLVPSWDPLACGTPHRVVLELEHEDGHELSTSAPCWTGGLVLDVPHWGLYRARVYAWRPGATTRDDAPVHALAIDAPVVRWQLSPPP